jgi:flagellar protein FlaG
MATQIEGIRGVAAAVGSGFSPPGQGAGDVSAPRLREAAIGPPDEVGLVFEVNQESRELVIKIVDRQTKQIIRQIPPEEVQRLRASMQSMLGLQLDRTG